MVGNPDYKVLIVEDDRDIRESLADTLEDEGYRVASVGNGEEALDWLERGVRPRLILLDLMMPVLDGWGFRLEQRRRPAFSDIPVIVVSADGNVKDKAESLGAQGYLRKPIQIRDLLALVERFCGPL